MLTSMVRSHSSTLSLSSGDSGITPALLTNTSMRPKASTVAAASFSRSARFATSVATAMASPPASRISATTWSSRSVRRAASTTLAPRAARWRAVDSPRPLLAPVTMATLPLMLS
ncbi:hypothetical protein D3C72_1819420 [compost metagenome]